MWRRRRRRCPTPPACTHAHALVGNTFCTQHAAHSACSNHPVQQRLRRHGMGTLHVHGQRPGLQECGSGDHAGSTRRRGRRPHLRWLDRGAEPQLRQSKRPRKGERRRHRRKHRRRRRSDGRRRRRRRRRAQPLGRRQIRGHRSVLRGRRAGRGGRTSRCCRDDRIGTPVAMPPRAVRMPRPVPGPFRDVGGRSSGLGRCGGDRRRRHPALRGRLQICRAPWLVRRQVRGGRRRWSRLGLGRRCSCRCAG